MKLHLGNLQTAMKDRGINQADLARATGWSEAKVSRLIKGITGDVTVAMLRELETALGVSAAYLLDLEDVAQTDEERRLLKKYRAAQERKRRLAQLALESDD